MRMLPLRNFLAGQFAGDGSGAEQETEGERKEWLHLVKSGSCTMAPPRMADSWAQMPAQVQLTD